MWSELNFRKSWVDLEKIQVGVFGRLCFYKGTLEKSEKVPKKLITWYIFLAGIVSLFAERA